MASGEYEARFYLAKNGEINLLTSLKMPPRQEAREKQGFITSSEAKAGLGAVGHKGRYIEDLKRKSAQKIKTVIRDIIAEHAPAEIHIFAPKHVFARVIEKLNKSEKKKIGLAVSKEFTKFSPLELIKFLASQEKRLTGTPTLITQEAKKILGKKNN